MKILRAIYECIESALLWYNLYLNNLKDLRFSINTYDRYVSNKMIDGKKCTTVWYVDDNKISHVDPNVVTDIPEEIKKHFGDMVISRGDTHDFLGMTIQIGNEKKLDPTTKYQIEYKAIQFKDICDLKVNSPCAQYLWDVNDEAKLLDDIRDDLFHSLTDKLLYITKRTRPDTELAV